MQLNGKSSRAQLLNRVLQNLGALLQFPQRHKLTGAMRFANIARPNHDRFTAERLHLRAFSAERDSAGIRPVAFSSSLISGESGAVSNPESARLASTAHTKSGSAALFFADCRVEEMQNMV